MFLSLLRYDSITKDRGVTPQDEEKQQNKNGKLSLSCFVVHTVMLLICILVTLLHHSTTHKIIMKHMLAAHCRQTSSKDREAKEYHQGGTVGQEKEGKLHSELHCAAVCSVHHSTHCSDCTHIGQLYHNHQSLIIHHIPPFPLAVCWCCSCWSGSLYHQGGTVGQEKEGKLHYEMHCDAVCSVHNSTHCSDCTNIRHLYHNHQSLIYHSPPALSNCSDPIPLLLENLPPYQRRERGPRERRR